MSERSDAPGFIDEFGVALSVEAERLIAVQRAAMKARVANLNTRHRVARESMTGEERATGMAKSETRIENWVATHEQEQLVQYAAVDRLLARKTIMAGIVQLRPEIDPLQFGDLEDDALAAFYEKIKAAHDGGSNQGAVTPQHRDDRSPPREEEICVDSTPEPPPFEPNDPGGRSAGADSNERPNSGSTNSKSSKSSHGTEENSQPPNSGIVAINLADFLKREFPPREMILAPIIPTQGLAMIFAARGIGKTFVALTIAYAVASGGRALRWAAEMPRRVLVIDGEMPAVTMQERLKMIAAGAEEPLPANDFFRIITPDLQTGSMPDLSTSVGQAAVEPHLDGIELVIVDNISCLCRDGVENEAESWLPVQAWALGLRRRGISVLFVHHAGKTGLQRGTSKREDVLDTVIALRRAGDYSPEAGADFSVHLEKARGVYGDDAKPFEARLEVRNGAAVWVMKDVDQATYDKIVHHLNGGHYQNEIASMLGIHKSTVSRHAKRAYAEGKAKPKSRRRPRTNDDDGLETDDTTKPW